MAYPAVGAFQKLLAWCEQDLDRVRAVQRVLKVVRGWEMATAHAKSAVPEDSRARMFLQGPNAQGTNKAYMFGAKHGKVDLGRVTGKLICSLLFCLSKGHNLHMCVWGSKRLLAFCPKLSISEI